MGVPLNFLIFYSMANKNDNNWWFGSLCIFLFFVAGICIAPLITLSIVWFLMILLSYWTKPISRKHAKKHPLK